MKIASNPCGSSEYIQGQKKLYDARHLCTIDVASCKSFLIFVLVVKQPFTNAFSFYVVNLCDPGYQAKVNAQEGRVMIFNLVEAAQEFLSEIAPLSESHESVSLHTVT